MAGLVKLKSNIAIALFLNSIAILLFEMAQIRVFSYSLPPILSYMGISLAMAGFGIGAMLFSLLPAPSRMCTEGTLSLLTLLQSFSMVIANLIFARVSWDCVLNANTGLFPLIVKILLPCSMPYFFAGLFFAILFSSMTSTIGKLYFLNLLGSAIGAILITIVLKPLGAEKVIGTAALLATVSALIIALPACRAMIVASLLLLVSLGLSLSYLPALLPFKPRPNDATGYYILRAAQERGIGGNINLEYSEWNIVAKIDIWSQEGKLMKTPDETEYRLLTVDSGAATVLIKDPGKDMWGKELFEETVYGLAYLLKPAPDFALVIGTGGGTDIQTALHWGAKSISAVEINSTIIDAVRGQFASFLKWPLSEKVHIIHEDGRSFVKNTKQRYDVIQLSGVDTLTLNATGSLNMVEEYLYTVESFEDYIAAMEPDGVLAVIRFMADDLRLAAIASEALLRQGITAPQNHIAAFRQGLTASILVCKSPFSQSQLASIRRIAERTTPNNVSIPPYEVFDFRLNNPITIVYLPNDVTTSEYREYFSDLASGPHGRARQFKQKAIPTDNNPFFMFMGLVKQKMNTPMESNFQLFKQFWVATIVLALVCILLPVFIFGRNISSPKPLLWILPYFSLIGLCFMMLEINIINWFTIFVGSPGQSIAVVLGSILIASGIGSYVSHTWKPERGILFATGVLVLYSILLKYLSPLIFDAFWRAGANQTMRGLIAGSLIMPLGFSMGWFFPCGLSAIDKHLSVARFVPWAISVNGFASVVGSVVALPITILQGFNCLFFLSLTGYLTAGIVTFLFFLKSRN